MLIDFSSDSIWLTTETELFIDHITRLCSSTESWPAVLQLYTKWNLSALYWQLTFHWMYKKKTKKKPIIIWIFDDKFWTQHPYHKKKVASIYYLCLKHLWENMDLKLTLCYQKLFYCYILLKVNVHLRCRIMPYGSVIDRCRLSSQHWPSRYMLANKGF